VTPFKETGDSSEIERAGQFPTSDDVIDRYKEVIFLLKDRNG
ncbi:hypothetical protein PSE305_55700, partial [Pseudomonas aeruginosa]